MDESAAVPLSDPVAKGCTRPAMKFGVPIGPLILVIGAVTWVAVVFNILLLAALVPIVFVMGQVTRTDDQAFRLLGLRILFRAANLNRGFWRAAGYSPIAFKKRRRA